MNRVRRDLSVKLGSCGSLREAQVLCNCVQSLYGAVAALTYYEKSYIVPIQAGDGVTYKHLLEYVGIGKKEWESFGGSIRHDDAFGSQSWLWWSGIEEREAFPISRDSKAEKVNLWFTDVWRDVLKYKTDVARVVGVNKELLSGLSNMAATSWLMWLCAAHPHIGSRAFDVLLWARRVPGRAKLVSTKVKSLGLQRHVWGSLLCELEALNSRETARMDVNADVRARTDREYFLGNKAARVDLGRLRVAVREILKEEMESRPRWPEVDKYWTRRWEFTKAGAHSKFAHQFYDLPDTALPEQPTRREFAEVCEKCIVADGEPRVDAGFSEKLEQGKRRAIYACDTRSYYTFDYLLRPIEAVWKNSSVLLDPGEEDVSTRYRRLSKREGTRLMLDFDDFNSQHTLEAMRVVYEEAFAHAPPAIRDWALASLDNSHVHWVDGAGLHVAPCVGTLFSGHRATTFINSILNAAYCRIAIGKTYSRVYALHAGDDVYMDGHRRDIDLALRAMTSSQFRMNPSKQVVGPYMGEFLRVCFTESSARGYVARAISAFVSGNWTNDTKNSKRDYVTTFLQNVWTVNARSSSSDLGLLAQRALERFVPETVEYSYELLTHQVSYDGSPVATDKSMEFEYTIIRPDGGLRKMYRDGLNAYVATQDYISNHINHDLLKEAGVTAGQLKAVMQKASEKPRRYGPEGEMTLERRKLPAVIPIAQESLNEMNYRPKKSAEAALGVIEFILPRIDWRRVASIVRGTLEDPISVTGVSEWPTAAAYSMPYSQMMSWRRKLTRPTSVLIAYPVYV